MKKFIDHPMKIRFLRTKLSRLAFIWMLIGCRLALLQAEEAHSSGLAYLPGVATPSEALRARELGFFELKFFPADLMGGPAWLRHVAQLYPDLRFCPTGGVSNDNVRSYLTLGNVFAAGGIYLAPHDLIEREQWSTLQQRAAESMAVAALKMD